MASANLGLTSPTVGADNNTWGDKLNADLALLDAKAGGVKSVATTGGTTTLNLADETNASIDVTGALVSDATVEFLTAVGGVWVFRNRTTGAFSLTAKVTGQTGVVVPQGAAVLIFSNGTDIFTIRVLPRVTSQASTGTPAPNADTDDQFVLTALAAAALFSAPSGTPRDGQLLLIAIKDNGTARALTYNAIYSAIGFTLPATTVISKWLYMGFRYNAAAAKWHCLFSQQET